MLLKKYPILSVYRNLKYLIIQKEYLIPQKPKRPAPFILNNIDTPKIKNIDPSMLSESQLKEVRENIQRQKQQRQVEFSRQLQQYSKELAKYKQLYVIPFQNHRFTSYTLFLQQQKGKITVQGPKMDIGTFAKIASKKFHALPKQEKEKLQKLAEEKRMQHCAQYQKLKDELRIPKVLNKGLSKLFLQRFPNEGGKFKQGYLYKFHALPEKQQKEMKELALKNSIQSKAKYEAFLKKFNLTHEELKFIRKVCKEVEGLKKELKKNKVKDPAAEIQEDSSDEPQ